MGHCIARCCRREPWQERVLNGIEFDPLIVTVYSWDGCRNVGYVATDRASWSLGLTDEILGRTS